MKISVIGTVNAEVILGPVVSLPEWGEQMCVPELETRYMGSAPSVARGKATEGADPMYLVSSSGTHICSPHSGRLTTGPRMTSALTVPMTLIFIYIYSLAGPVDCR